tara:strand:+ start:77 stop:187 length:111 start_codon:yes stop_codon:yes gene_type:complete
VEVAVKELLEYVMAVAELVLMPVMHLNLYLQVVVML